MRTVAHVPHSLMRITVNHWNDKFQLRYELDRYEQTFKFDAEHFSLEAVQIVANNIADDVLKNFVTMRSVLQIELNENPPQ